MIVCPSYRDNSDFCDFTFAYVHWKDDNDEPEELPTIHVAQSKGQATLFLLVSCAAKIE